MMTKETVKLVVPTHPSVLAIHNGRRDVIIQKFNNNLINFNKYSLEELFQLLEDVCEDTVGSNYTFYNLRNSVRKRNGFLLRFTNLGVLIESYLPASVVIGGLEYIQKHRTKIPADTKTKYKGEPKYIIKTPTNGKSV